jgi:O-antigen ligase
LQRLIRETILLFQKSKALLFQLVLIALSSYGGTTGSTVVVLGILFWNFSQNKLSDALTIFLVLLYFSDSAYSLYSTPGKAKDLAALSLVFFIFSKTTSPIQKSYLFTFLPYFFIALAGLLFVKFEVVGLQKLISYFLMLIIVPASVKHLLSKPGAGLFLAKLVFVFLAFYAFSVVMSRIRPEQYATFGRFNGIHRNPNGVGVFISLFIMNMVLIRDKYPRLFSRPFFIAFLVFCFLAMFLSGSRNAILSTGVFFLFRTIRVKFFVGLILVLLIASTYGVISYFAEMLIINLGLAETFRLDTLSYASGRIYIWDACWREIQHNYWLGHGFSFEELNKWDQKYLVEIPELIHNYGNIHNSYLTIWLNTGLLGLAAFLGGMITLVVRAQEKSPSIAPLFFAALFLGFFESYMVASLNPFTWQLWFGFAIASVTPLKQVIRKKKPRKIIIRRPITSAPIG